MMQGVNVVGNSNITNFQNPKVAQKSNVIPEKSTYESLKNNKAMLLGLGAIATSVIAGIAIHHKIKSNALKDILKATKEFVGKNEHNIVETIDNTAIKNTARELVDVTHIKDYKFYAHNLTEKQYTNLFEADEKVIVRCPYDVARTLIVAMKDGKVINANIVKGCDFASDIAKWGNEFKHLI